MLKPTILHCTYMVCCPTVVSTAIIHICMGCWSWQNVMDLSRSMFTASWMAVIHRRHQVQIISKNYTRRCRNWVLDRLLLLWAVTMPWTVTTDGTVWKKLIVPSLLVKAYRQNAHMMRLRHPMRRKFMMNLLYRLSL